MNHIVVDKITESKLDQCPEETFDSTIAPCWRYNPEDRRKEKIK